MYNRKSCQTLLKHFDLKHKKQNPLIKCWSMSLWVPLFPTGPDWLHPQSRQGRHTTIVSGLAVTSTLRMSSTLCFPLCTTSCARSCLKGVKLLIWGGWMMQTGENCFLRKYSAVAEYLEKGRAKRRKSTFRWDTKSVVLLFYWLLYWWVNLGWIVAFIHSSSFSLSVGTKTC